MTRHSITSPSSVATMWVAVVLGLVTRAGLGLAMENNGVTNHLNIVACAASHNQATPATPV